MKEVTEKQLKSILESYFWLPSLQAMKRYFRTHDDCDGDRFEGISVIIGNDGDTWVAMNQRDNSCRYRVPFTGGGLSHRTRNALLILAYAIKMDNDEHDLTGNKEEEKNK